MKDTVLFLGSGATAGSGIKLNERALPADRSFFCSALVQERLKEGHYPALRYVLSDQARFCHDGLSNTWNSLHLARSFGRATVLNEGARAALLGSFKDILATDGVNDGSQVAHYQIQARDYEVRYGTISEENPSWSEEKLKDEVFGLAIWDLRLLVCRVFSIPPSVNNHYEEAWKTVADRVAGVVNLNYDTTFEDSMSSQLKEVPVLKPHGSVKWLKWNRLHLGHDWLSRGAPWPVMTLDSFQHDWGFRNLSGGIAEFIEPNIVSPDNYKDVLVGGSNTVGIVDPLLREAWLRMDCLLRRSDHFLFIGFSLSAADAHLAFLISNAVRLKPDREKQPRVHVTYVGEQCESKDQAKACGYAQVYADALHLTIGEICTHRLSGRTNVGEILQSPAHASCPWKTPAR